MANASRLFNLDTVMIDVVMMIEGLPVRGGDALSSERVLTAGGGFNVMSAAARHGMEVVYAGQFGVGPFSDIARAALDSEQIRAPIAADASEDVGFCVVLVDGEGERTFVTSPGAEKRLRASALEALDVRAQDYVFLSGYSVVYEEIGAAVVQWLATLPDGVIVAFDPAPRAMDIPAEMLATVLARADWLLCNASEAVQLAGSDTLADALDNLWARTGRHGIVIHNAEEGCLVKTHEIPATRIPAFTTSVLDTNGAGDTHDGVFLAELALGTSVLEAALRANAAAALAISRFGPATCPTRDEVTQWLATEMV